MLILIILVSATVGLALAVLPIKTRAHRLWLRLAGLGFILFACYFAWAFITAFQ